MIAASVDFVIDEFFTRTPGKEIVLIFSKVDFKVILTLYVFPTDILYTLGRKIM